MAPASHITPRTFRFLKDLARNNDREWFNANKQRYIDEVRDPLLRWVGDFGPKLEKISPHLLADPRPVGGSLFRIYRDTRFARDKSPYKTYAGLTFRHIDGKEVSAPGFYLHLEPGRIFTAAGMWHAPNEALTQVRDAIVKDPERWQRITRKVPLDEGSDALKRAPRGYDPEHPLVEDLKRKGFTASTNFTQSEACAADFLKRVTHACRATAPLMAFLADAVRVDF